MSSSAPPPLPSLLPEIGPDGIARESPVIAYTEKKIEEEQLQLKRYIQENYSKIRDVERELEGLTLEMKLTSGPKKAALEHMRKKIELATEKIRLAKIKEEEAKKVWEAAAQAVKDEEANKQMLCDDLNQLVQESTSTQFTRLEELKRRLESLCRGRVSLDAPEAKPMEQNNDNAAAVQTAQKQAVDSSGRVPQNASTPANNNSEPATSDSRNQRTVEVKEKRKTLNTGRGKGNLILAKGRGTSGPGWTGAGFDVDNGT